MNVLKQIEKLSSQASWSEAIELCNVYLDEHQNSVDGWFWLGKLACFIGEYKQAIDALEKALSLQDCATVHYYLGAAYLNICPEREMLNPYAALDSEQVTSALEHYQKAIVLNPAFISVYIDLGNLHLQLGHWVEAEAYFLEALSIDPNTFLALNNLGFLYLSLSRYEDSLFYFEKALAVEYSPVVLNNLGLLGTSTGAFSRAAEYYRQAIIHFPEHWVAYKNLGLLLLNEAKNTARALICFEQALEYGAPCEDIYNLIGDLYEKIGDVQEAFKAYQQAFDANGNWLYKVKQSLLVPVIPNSSQEIEANRNYISHAIEQLFNKKLQPFELTNKSAGMPFYLAYHGLKDRQILELLAGMYLSSCPELNFTAPHCLNEMSHKPYKVGVVSHYLHSKHPIDKFFSGLLQQLSHSGFEIIIFYFEQVNEELSASKVLLPGELFQARQQIAEYELDLLLYPDIGMFPLTYFLAFSRLAPVQCVTWGHGSTTGIPTIDYFISCLDLEPEGSTGNYSEQLVVMNELLPFYQSVTSKGDSLAASDWGVARQANFYLCPHSLFKIHPEFDEIIVGLLKADPLGQIVFIEGSFPQWQSALELRFQKKGIDKRRILFIPRQKQLDFLRLIASADVILDTIHAGGGITSYDALAIGTPIVTLPTPDISYGRVTFALYKKMDFMDCVVYSQEDYIQKAVQLATDKEYNQSCRQKILRKNGVLYENRKAVDEFQDLLLKLLK